MAALELLEAVAPGVDVLLAASESLFAFCAEMEREEEEFQDLSNKSTVATELKCLKTLSCTFQDIDLDGSL